MSSELDRFLKLFDALVISTNAWIAKTPPDKLDWHPFDNPNMKFGDRISKITIRSLYIHTLVGEHGWATMLRDCHDDDSFRPTPDTDLTERLMASHQLIPDALKLHQANMKIFAGYSDERLRMNLRWVGKQWTVMGFLWGIYSHRSYHLGNMDLYLRQADVPAPDFFSTFQDVLA